MRFRHFVLVKINLLSMAMKCKNKNILKYDKRSLSDWSKWKSTVRFIQTNEISSIK